MSRKREKTQLEKVFDGHDKWLKTVMNFGCTKEEAEDIVGDMYVTIGKMLQKGLDISYNDEINYYYIYVALKSRFINMVKKDKKMIKVTFDDWRFDSEWTDDMTWSSRTGFDKMFDDFIGKTSSEDVYYEMAKDELDKELAKINWYDAKVFTLISSGMPVAELSRLTGISYHSLYQTNKRTREHLKSKLIE